MKARLSILAFLILAASAVLIAQDSVKTDKVILYTGKSMIGEVIKIGTETIDFRDNSTGLLNEIKKSQVKKLVLTNGEVLTFSEYAEDEQLQEPVKTKREKERTADFSFVANELDNAGGHVRDAILWPLVTQVVGTLLVLVVDSDDGKKVVFGITILTSFIESLVFNLAVANDLEDAAKELKRIRSASR
jgi:hypothetical protein